MFRSKLCLPLLAALALAACDNAADSGAGRLSIRLVDAPGDLAEAHVQISEIYLQGAAESDSTAGRLQLAGSSNTYYDLLTLSGGNFAPLVQGATVPAGTYSSLRIKVGEAYVVTKDGDVYATASAQLPAGLTAAGDLQRTRGKASGYQIKFAAPGLTVSGETQILALDFDVNRSFGHVAGNSGKFVMNPQFTATQVTLAGGIRGSVAATGVTFPACGGAATDLTHFVATAASAGGTLTANATADGTYAMPYVAPDSYTMGVAPVGYANGDTLTFVASANPASTAVASGQTATVDYTMTAADCKVKPAG